MEAIENVRETIQTKGYAIVRGVVSHEDIRIAKNRVEEIAANRAYYESVGIGYLPEPSVDIPERHPPLARYARISNLPFRDAICWRHLLAHPNLVRLVHAVLQDDFYVNNAGFFMKPGRHGAAVPWHQDSTVWGLTSEAWSHTNAPLLFDYWMALDPATRENGCLQLLPESHRKGLLPHKRKNGLLAEADPAEFGFDPTGAVPIELAPGELVVWHQDMFHSSGPNRSESSRLGMVGTFFAERDRELMQRVRPRVDRLGKLPVYQQGFTQDIPNPIPLEVPVAV